MLRRVVLGGLVAVSAVACSDANLAEPEGLGLVAADYLDDALDLMQFNSIKRNEIDWPTFRMQAVEEAGNAKTAADAYDAIRGAVARLDDGHSSFQPPISAPLLAVSTVASAPLRIAAPGPLRVDPSANAIDSATGYLEVPPFAAGGAEADAHAGLYHALLEQVDTLGVCRWVVDLRGNTGGNMWPMLAGLGPILGPGPFGSFIDPDSIIAEWFYDQGAAGFENEPITTAPDPYTLTVPMPPVAVLTDSVTASAAEAITVAFRARPDTRSFGDPTFGIPTAVAPYGLSDRAVLFLAVAWTADRTGSIYEDALVPDSIVPGQKTGDRTTDAALDAAVAWLEAFPCS